jgi:4-amino-4-deoxy-L-arabinose transferase-like glycosyltransferase
VLAGSTLVSEALFIPLVLVGIWLVLRYRDDPRLRWLVLAGIGSGLIVLCRSNGVLVALALAFGVWILRPRWSWSALGAPAAVIGVAALVVLPWTIRNAIELDAFVPVSTQDGFAIAGQYNDTSERNGSRWLPPNGVPAYRHFFRDRGLDEAGLNSDLRSAALDFAVNHPAHIVAAGFWNTLRLFNLDDPIALERQAAADLGEPDTLARLSVYGFWLLAALAILGCLAGAARRIPLFIWLVAGAILVSIMFIAGLTRYRTPADFLLILLAAPALTWAWRRAAARPRPEPA